MKAEFHPAASEEIVETAVFYDNEVPGLGDRFISEVERVVELLREQQQIGQQIEKEFRRIVLARFPYSLIYRIEPKKNWVVAVAHQRRRPDYWRERIGR